MLPNQNLDRSHAGKTRTYLFTVSSITCTGCTGTIEKLLMESKEVAPLRVTANVVTQIVEVVVADDRPETDRQIYHAVRDVIRTVNHKIDPLDMQENERSDPARVESQKQTKPDFKKSASKDKHTLLAYFFKGIVGLATGLTLMIVMALGIVIPFWGMCLIAALSTALTIYLGYDTYKSFLAELRNKSLKMNALFAVSTLTAVGVSIAALFVPWLPMMFDAALMIFGFRHVGVGIEQMIRRKIARRVLFKDKVPRDIEFELDGVIQETTIDKLKVGDIIRVRRGRPVPVDCELMEGKAIVYKPLMKGDSYTDVVTPGQTILAGMQFACRDDYVRVRVKKIESQSYLARADRKLDEAQNKRAPIVEAADKVLRFFVPAVFGVAIISGIIMGCLFPPAIAIQCVIATLVSACPCTLGFIAPLAMHVAIAKGRDHKVDFKDGEAVQRAAGINTIVFDMNGTLTMGKPEVTRMAIYKDQMTREDKIKRDDALRCMCLLEQHARKYHPVAKAIYHCAEQKGVIADIRQQGAVEFDTEKYNNGVRAKIDGVWYTLGNKTMLQNLGIEIQDEKAPGPSVKGVEQLIYLARGDEVVCRLNLVDYLRGDAVDVVSELKKTKMVYIATGGDRDSALQIARQLNIPDNQVFSDCLPVDDEGHRDKKKPSKTRIIDRLIKQGHRVAFVGDGGNDAIGMGSCFGVAVKSPAAEEITQQSASAVLDGDKLEPLVSMFKIASQSIRYLRASLVMSIAYNMTTLLIAGGLLVAAGFILNPAIGVALMVAQACLILAGAYYCKSKAMSPLPTAIPASNVIFRRAAITRVASPEPNLRPACDQSKSPFYRRTKPQNPQSQNGQDLASRRKLC